LIGEASFQPSKIAELSFSPNTSTKTYFIIESLFTNLAITSFLKNNRESDAPDTSRVNLPFLYQ
jgi:hypothetical protein